MRVDARSQIDLLDGAAAHIVELKAKTIAIGRRALDHAGPFQGHQGTMRSALVQIHALADLGQA